MPQAIIPIITALVSVAGTVSSLESGGGHGGGTPSAPKPTPPSANDLLLKKEAIGQQLPNVVSETSGLANPEYTSLISQILAGTLGTPGSTAAGNEATGQFTSISNAPVNAAVSGRTDLSDFIDRFVR